jgi:hypothetical protein
VSTTGTFLQETLQLLSWLHSNVLEAGSLHTSHLIRPQSHHRTRFAMPREGIVKASELRPKTKLDLEKQAVGFSGNHRIARLSRRRRSHGESAFRWR